MFVENDPFRAFDSFFGRSGTRAAMAMPMDAYRRGTDVWVHLDLPGVAIDSLDITVERSVLTVQAERHWQREEGDQVYLAERPRGTFRRQVHLGEGLDADAIEADFSDGVLTLRIPVAEKAQPRRVAVTRSAPAIDVESSVPAS